MVIQLKIIRGPQAGKTHSFDDDIITLGSGRSNDIVIHDNDVSTQHCRLVRLDTDYDIEDLSSRYGTFVNGQKLNDEKWMLQSGSIIELGSQITIEYTQLRSDNDTEQPNPAEQYCLVLAEEGRIKEAYLLQSQTITIGRSLGNDIIIQETDVSRTHARLIWRDESYNVEDVNSRNGTFLNGVALKESLQLHRNDILRLGASTQLHFVRRVDLPKEWDPVHTDTTTTRDRPTEESTLIETPFKWDGNRELTAHYTNGELNEHILIAYARKDWEDIVAPIMLNLEDAKQKVWANQHLRPDSQAWQAAMEQAQTECWLLLVVVSPDAMKTHSVRDLYRYFFNREKPIILVDYSPVERLPIQLSQMPRIPYDRESPGKMFRRLLYEIMQMKPRYVDDRP